MEPQIHLALVQDREVRGDQPGRIADQWDEMVSDAVRRRHDVPTSRPVRRGRGG
jgi:hypothetical protein